MNVLETYEFECEAHNGAYHFLFLHKIPHNSSEEALVKRVHLK